MTFAFHFHVSFQKLKKNREKNEIINDDKDDSNVFKVKTQGKSGKCQKTLRFCSSHSWITSIGFIVYYLPSIKIKIKMEKSERFCLTQASIVFTQTQVRVYKYYISPTGS